MSPYLNLAKRAESVARADIQANQARAEAARALKTVAAALGAREGSVTSHVRDSRT